MWAVIEQPGLQHHFFSVKANALVRTRVVVMSPNRVLVFPRETKLKVMAGNSFVDGDRPGIHRGRAPEIAKFFRRLRHVTNAVLSQSGRRREIVLLRKPKRAQIFGSWSKRVMLDPSGHSQDAAVLEKFSDLNFLFSCVFDPAIDVRRSFERWHIFVPILLEN